MRPQSSNDLNQPEKNAHRTIADIFTNRRLTAGLLGATLSASVILLGATPALADPATANNVKPASTVTAAEEDVPAADGATVAQTEPESANLGATVVQPENSHATVAQPEAQPQPEAQGAVTTPSEPASPSQPAPASPSQQQTGSVIYNSAEGALKGNDTVEHGTSISATDAATGNTMSSGWNSTVAILDVTKSGPAIDGHVKVVNKSNERLKVDEIVLLNGFGKTGQQLSDPYRPNVVIDESRIQNDSLKLGLDNEDVKYSVEPGMYHTIAELRAANPNFSWSQLIAIMAIGYLDPGSSVDAVIPLKIANYDAIKGQVESLTNGTATQEVADAATSRTFDFSALNFYWQGADLRSIDAGGSSIAVGAPRTRLMDSIRRVTRGEAHWDATVMTVDNAGRRIYDPAPAEVQDALKPLAYSDFIFRNRGVEGGVLYTDGSFDIKLENAFNSIKNLGYTVNILPDGSNIWPYYSYTPGSGRDTVINANGVIYLQVSQVFDTRDLTLDRPGAWSAADGLVSAKAERYNRGTMRLTNTENLLDTGDYGFELFDANGKLLASGRGNDRVDHLGPGTYTVRYSYAINPDHVVTKTATISVKALALAVGQPADTVYNGAEQRQAAAVTDESGNVLTDGTDYTISYTPAVDAGTVTITVTGRGNYAGTVTRTYRIVPASLVVTTDGATRVYDGTALTAGGSIEGLVGGETVTLRTTGSQTDVGSSANGYELVWDGTAKKGNYRVDGENIHYLDVMPATASVVTNGATRVYDGTALTAGGRLVGLVNGETATLRTTGSQTDAGSSANGYELVWDGSAKQGNYRIGSEALGDLTVTPAPLTVSTGSATTVYPEAAVSGESAAEGLVNGETVTVRATGRQDGVGSSANTYELVWDGTAKRGNYTVAAERLGTLTVKPASIDPNDPDYTGFDVTRPADVVYNGAEQRQAVAVDDGNGRPLSKGTDYDISYTPAIDAGTVTVTVTGHGNYTGSVTRTYRITPATVTVETGSGSKVYDGTALTAGGRLVGLVNGETATLRATGSQADASSSTNGYVLLWDGTAKEGNYRLAGERLGTLTVTPAPLTVTTDGGSKTYDGSALTADGSVSGLVDGQAVTLKTTGSQTDAGSSANGYELVWDGSAKKGNYRLAGERLGTLTVTPAPLTVATGSATTVYPDAATSADASLSGLVNGETATVRATGRQDGVGSSTNTYELVWDGTAKKGNYRVAAERLGTLTVKAAPAKPDDPAKPEDPAEPADPAKPAQPESPAQPADVQRAVHTASSDNAATRAVVATAKAPVAEETPGVANIPVTGDADNTAQASGLMALLGTVAAGFTAFWARMRNRDQAE